VTPFLASFWQVAPSYPSEQLPLRRLRRPLRRVLAGPRVVPCRDLRVGVAQHPRGGQDVRLAAHDVVLDVDEETEADIEWTRENVLELAAQWRRARELLDRVGALARRLEAEPPARFARLLEAALGQDAHLSYERATRPRPGAQSKSAGHVGGRGQRPNRLEPARRGRTAARTSNQE